MIGDILVLTFGIVGLMTLGYLLDKYILKPRMKKKTLQKGDR